MLEENTNDLDQTDSGIQKLTCFVRGSPVADLSTFPEENPRCTLLQYLDGLLLASHNQEKCWEGTKTLLA
jgi:hypothetical protein